MSPSWRNSPPARSHQPRLVVAGHREHVNGSSGGHGFTAHIRDVYFSRYLDRPSLTIITPLSAIPRKKKGKGSYDFPHKWTLLTRLQ